MKDQVNVPSKKRVAIDKDQQRILIAIAVAAAAIVFSLFASRVLWSKISHQRQVISAKQAARDQLDLNLESLEKLESSYLVFDQEPESILGNSGESNAKVVLDALPSKYDYAALLTSLEEVASEGGISISEISGADLELEAQQSSDAPAPEIIELRIGVDTTYGGAETFLELLERSIRPFDVRSINLTGEDSQLNASIELTTHYQPETNVGILSEEIN